MPDPHDPALALFAARMLTDRLAAVRQYVEPVRAGGDAEAVHQMRVASRRLRAALTAFESALPAKAARRWDKQTKRVTKALGDARDLDVQIAWVEDILQQTALSHHKTGLRRLRLRLAQQREAQQPALESEMHRLLQAEVMQRMPDELHDLTVRATRAGGHADDPAIQRHASRQIEPALEQMLAYDSIAGQPHLAEQLHRLRIAAKRLRYTLEIFAPLYAGTLDKPIKHVKKIQSALGDVHDMDVWIDWLPTFVQAERARTRDFQGHLRGFKRVAGGIEHLREHCIGQRERAYERFLSQWRSKTRKGAWSKLRKTLEHPPDPRPAQPHQTSDPDAQPPDGNAASEPPQIVVTADSNDPRPAGSPPAPRRSTDNASKIIDN